MKPSPDQDTSNQRQRRVRRTAGLLAGGAVVATSAALALPALATTEDQPPAASGPPARPAPAAEPAAFTAPASTTTTTAPPSPLELFAARWTTWSPQEQLMFRLWVGTPEERTAIFTWLFPPRPAPPRPAAPRPAPAPRPAAPAAKRVPPAAPAPRPQAASSAPGGYLACVRQHESGGRYGINTGNGYYGAYQFLPSTWNSTARHAGRTDLVGVLPSNASPADQDAMAQHLLSWQGRQPWAGNGC